MSTSMTSLPNSDDASAKVSGTLPKVHDTLAANPGPTDLSAPAAESPDPMSESDKPSLPARIKTLLIGKPRDLADESLFKHVSLVAFLAWVGLGADGLSSSCYG